MPRASSFSKIFFTKSLQKTVGVGAVGVGAVGVKGLEGDSVK